MLRLKLKKTEIVKNHLLVFIENLNTLQKGMMRMELRIKKRRRVT